MLVNGAESTHCFFGENTKLDHSFMLLHSTVQNKFQTY